MAAPVAVQGAEHAFALDYFLQSCHHGQRRFFFHQLRVIDLAAGIVQNDNQVIPALILEPAMPAAIDVQQHTRQRTPRSSFAMHSALAPPLYQPGSLQGQFHPGVAECNLVLGAQLLMKMSHVQIEILLPVESQNLLHQGHGDSLGRGLPSPSIEQPVIAELFVALAPATHVPVANTHDLRCLPPRDPFRHRPQDYFLYFHCPLHRGLRVRNHASHGLLPSPPEKRTYHVLSQPDISCANDKCERMGSNGGNPAVTCACDIKTKVQAKIQRTASRRECPPSGEILELYQLRSPRDQLQDRVLRRGPWRQYHQPSAYLSEDRRAAERQNDLACHRDRANSVF